MRTKRLPAVLILLVTVLASCNEESPPADPSQQALEGSVYVRSGARLVTVLIPEGSTDKASTLPRGAVLSPDATRYVFQTGKPTSPKLRISVIGATADESLGPGATPVFSPDGSRLAALTNAPGYSICDKATGTKDEKGCNEARRVALYTVDPPSGPTVGLGAGLWSRIVWTAEASILAISSDSATIAFPPEGESIETIPVHHPPAFLWGISPVEHLLLVNPEGRALFVMPTGEVVRELDLGGSKLGDGAFSPDGRYVATILEGEQRGVAVIEVATGAITRIEGSEDVREAPLWDTSSEIFSFLAKGSGGTEVWLCSPPDLCAAPIPVDLEHPEVAAVVATAH